MFWLVVAFALIKPDISSVVVSVFNVIGFRLQSCMYSSFNVENRVWKLLQSQRYLLIIQTAATHMLYNESWREASCPVSRAGLIQVLFHAVLTWAHTHLVPTSLFFFFLDVLSQLPLFELHYCLLLAQFISWSSVKFFLTSPVAFKR